MKKANKIRIGDCILNGNLSPLYVEDIGMNSLGSIIVRCSYSLGTYPGITLILPSDELVEVC